MCGERVIIINGVDPVFFIFFVRSLPLLLECATVHAHNTPRSVFYPIVYRHTHTHTAYLLLCSALEGRVNIYRHPRWKKTTQKHSRREKPFMWRNLGPFPTCPFIWWIACLRKTLRVLCVHLYASFLLTVYSSSSRLKIAIFFYCALAPVTNLASQRRPIDNRFAKTKHGLLVFFLGGGGSLSRINMCAQDGAKACHRSRI